MSKNEQILIKQKGIINLSDLKNIPKLSSYEQKTVTILMLARNELERLEKDDLDFFAKLILDYLKENVPDFNELEKLFDRYNSEKNTFVRTSIFKKIKPIESLAVFLSECAVVYNKVDKTSDITIKAFVYNLILHWFVAEEMKSTYLNEFASLDFQPQINKFIENTKENKEHREKLNRAFDNSIEIVEFLKTFSLKPIVPTMVIKKRRNKI